MRGYQVVKLCVEGGGDAAALKTACREGFAMFLGRLGCRMPRIVACGSPGGWWEVNHARALSRGQYVHGTSKDEGLTSASSGRP